MKEKSILNILRPYQVRDDQKIEEAWETSNNVLYQSPTGSGKSLILESKILKYQKEKLLILVHKRELVFQLKSRLEKQGLKVGIIIGNIEENIDSNIIIASIRTVTRDKRIETILSRGFDKIFIDEAHHVRTSSYENVLDKYGVKNPNHKLLGVTATPYRKDRKPLNKYFQSLVLGDDIQTLQNNGFLAKYKVFYTPVPEIDEEVESSGNEYQIQSLSNYMRKPEMLQFLVDSYKKEGNEGQMIIFCVDKKHAKDVQAIYRKNGYTSIDHIDSDTNLNERAKILKQFAENKLRIITCIETLTEGVDLPETKVIQLARPTKSLVLYLQMVGRGARPKADGSDCILLDNAGCSLEHRLPNSPREWSLNPNINPSNPGKKHKVVGKRADGSFTEDETEMAFLELIEMTPEEYAMNMDGGIEKSEKLNEEYDKQCIQILVDLGNFLLNKLKETEYTVDQEKYSNDWSKDFKIIKLQNKKGDYVCINFSNFLKITKEDRYYVRDKESSINNLKLQIFAGKLSEEFLKEKTYNYVFEEFTKVNEIQNQKVNISELKSLKKEFEKDQFKIKLQHYIAVNSVITLPKTISLGSYFRNEDSYWSRYNKSYNKITLSKNKLNLNNDVVFSNDEGESKQKQIKQEKLIEILNHSGWVVSTQQISN